MWDDLLNHNRATYHRFLNSLKRCNLDNASKLIHRFKRNWLRRNILDEFVDRQVQWKLVPLKEFHVLCNKSRPCLSMVVLMSGSLPCIDEAASLQ